MQPKPAKVLDLEGENDNSSQHEQNSQRQEYFGTYYNQDWWAWGDSIGCITNPNSPGVQCYKCGGFGYIGVNCPNKDKGKGKGGGPKGDFQNKGAPSQGGFQKGKGKRFPSSSL
eukprot:9497085-Karenia_brevis.AAC.1